jgi:hypothetical protein
MTDCAVLCVDLRAQRIGSAVVHGLFLDRCTAMDQEVEELIEPSILHRGETGHAALATVKRDSRTNTILTFTQ